MVVDDPNPYQAPEAALPAEVPLPAVHEAIAVLCWLVGVPLLLAGLGCGYLLGSASVQFGWRRAMLSGPGPRVLLVAISSLLGSFAYLAAARMLRARRGGLGLALCAAAIFLTYLAALAFLRN